MLSPGQVDLPYTCDLPTALSKELFESQAVRGAFTSQCLKMNNYLDGQALNKKKYPKLSVADRTSPSRRGACMLTDMA